MTAEFRRPRTHGLWTRPTALEVDAPAHRIIHAVHAGLATASTVRPGIRPGRGYRKCGSRDETDWVRDLRVFAWDGHSWSLVADLRDLPRGVEGVTEWLPPVDNALGVLVEVRRTWIDDWWPSWNLVTTGVVFEADWLDPPLRPRPATPMASAVDLGGLPAGVAARHVGGEVRFRTSVLEIGFRLGRPALSFLAFDPDGLPDRPRDLLRHATLFEGDGNDWITNHPLFGQFALGPQVVTPDGLSHIGQFTAVDQGRTVVRGSSVSYILDVRSAGQHYEARWTVRPDSIDLAVAREAAEELRALESSAWHLAFDARVSPPCLLGRPEKAGEVGATRAPAFLHAPGFGSLAIRGTGAATLRLEAARPLMTTAFEVKVGEEPGELGDHGLPAGRHEGGLTFEVTHGAAPSLGPEAPASVRAGVRRAWLTGLTYRMDTTALSNNGASIHVVSAMDEWAALAARIGRIDAGLDALDLVRDTIDRYLDGAPGYMAGRTSFHDGLIQDEYVQTDASVMLGLAHLLAGRPDRAWLAARSGAIREILRRMRARDVDDDGLVESVLRTGVTGRFEWSSNACDIVSFGWKDAYTNALLYDALVRLTACLAGKRWADVRTELDAWAVRLKAAYLPAFWNPETSRVAGWRSIDGLLHDAGYLWVNGAAVDAGLLPEALAREAVEGLWNGFRAGGFSDLRLGLPINLEPIPRGDMVERYAGMPYGLAMPHGFYMNGSVSLTLLRSFVTALERVGMTAEADAMLEATMGAFADGTAFGGCTSGDDLHTWDGTPCGYEGILTYQFGIVGAALARYGQTASSP